MPALQFQPIEIAQLFDKALPLLKRNKFRFLLFYFFFIIYFSIPTVQVPFLEYSRFRVTSLMEQRAIEKDLIYYPRQSWTDVEDVNPNLLRAIISMEDGSFFNHKGVDWKELKTSLRVNKRRGRAMRGGSTLTMQVSKNLFFTTGKNLFRKAKEFVVTARLEKELSKKAIIEKYINAAEWGEGIFGIKKAARVYFNKDPKDLTKNECSRLAAVLPSPIKHAPNKNSRYVLRRSSIIRGRMSDIILFPE
jgi:monofunctional biosynthetic peptidoglycan transglycosylase